MSKAVGWFKSLMWRIGHRGAFLAFLAILDYLYGYSLLIVPRNLRNFDLILPWNTWAIIWLAMGVILTFGVFAKKDRVHFGLAAAVKALWAAAFVDLAIFQHVPNAWVSIVIWGCFSALVVIVSWWPDYRPRTDKDEQNE